VSLAVTAAVAVLLAGSIRSRDAAQPITGDAGATDTLAFFQQRVQQHPHDVAARLDLAERYRDAGMTGLATLQYTEALQLDPSNAEALTGMADSLFGQGQSKQALAEVTQALAVDPTYPEALYEQGVILLRGCTTGRAERSFNAYLALRPTGRTARQLKGCSPRSRRRRFPAPPRRRDLAFGGEGGGRSSASRRDPISSATSSTASMSSASVRKFTTCAQHEPVAEYRV
jgi:lipoprotein NlpI